MLNINLKARLENKTFWVSIISVVILLFSRYGVDLTQYIGKDWQDSLNNIFTILALLGIVVDTSTKGISDSSTTSTEEATTTDNIETNTSTTNNVQSVTSTVTNVNDTSASANLNVVNPDNDIEDGKNVVVTEATTPTV